MRKAVSIFSLGTVLSFCAISFCASGSKQQWTGYVTDTHCGTHCQVTSKMTPYLKCIRSCVKKGSKYGLWVGKHVYVLEPQAKAAAFAAKNVKVEGVLKGNTIQMASIVSALKAPRAKL